VYARVNIKVKCMYIMNYNPVQNKNIKLMLKFVIRRHAYIVKQIYILTHEIKDINNI